MNRNPQLCPKRHLCLSRTRHEVLLPLIPSRRAEWSRSTIPAAWSVGMVRVGAWPWAVLRPIPQGMPSCRVLAPSLPPQPCSLSPTRLPAVVSTITATSFWIASACLWETMQRVYILLHSQAFSDGVPFGYSRGFFSDEVIFIRRWRSPVCCCYIAVGITKQRCHSVCF